MGQLVDWDSEESYLFVNPACRADCFPRLDQLPGLRSHIWLATSGSSATQSEVKLIALSKEALLTSAAAVNGHLQVQNDDRWLLALPEFHVGGLGIHARAWLSSCVVVRGSGAAHKWGARDFHRELNDSKITLVSLVPTQLWDLVQAKLSPPASLRAVLVGGGALSPILRQQARELGWPALPTYGLTECCSQVATAPLASLGSQEPSPLRILPHVQIREQNGRLALRSRSLLTGMATCTTDGVQFSDPKMAGWYLTNDVAEIREDYLVFRGRVDELVKIKGENVSQLALQGVLEKVLTVLGLPLEAQLLALRDPRLGHRLVMALTIADESVIRQIADRFNAEVLPHEKVTDCYTVPLIPRTALGKVNTKELALLLART